jgi:hypothetical protein
VQPLRGHGSFRIITDACLCQAAAYMAHAILRENTRKKADRSCGRLKDSGLHGSPCQNLRGLLQQLQVTRGELDANDFVHESEDTDGNPIDATIPDGPS